MDNLTIEEAEKDSNDSAKDINYLNRIVDGLTAFIDQPGHNVKENRFNYKANLWLYESLLDQAKLLDKNINEKLTELKKQASV